ncbi:MAG: hypothetical protein Q8Q52_08630 [Acidimicrobiia bacterium]|nr:hypothetical protein [Acidimicrobiia bacterium]
MSLFLVMAAPALASHVDPVFIVGNQNCQASTGLTEVARFEGNEIADGSSEGGVTIQVNGAAQTIDWTSSVLIGAVFVKGGHDGNLYDYRPAGATSDTGLHAPNNPKNNGFFGLSHITFCVTTAEETTTTAEETTTTAAGTTTTTAAGTTTTTAAGTTTTTAEVGGIVVTNPSNPQVSNTSASTASTLPFTGMSSGSMAIIGAALAGMGSLLLVASRKGEDKLAVRSWS